MWVKSKTTASGGDDYVNLNNCSLVAAHPDGSNWTISVRDLNDTARQLDCTFDTEEQAGEAVRRLVGGVDAQDFA